MVATKKTDNSFLADKIALRVSNLPDKKVINILDAFHGTGVIWEMVRRKTDAQLLITSMDLRNDITKFHWHGDNEKIIGGIDLEKYDVIDVDSYGIPSAILAEIFASNFKGVVFATVIQTAFGAIGKIIARDVGLPKTILEVAPSLVSRRGWDYFCQWLSKNGIREINHRSHGRKHYISFRINCVGQS